MDRNHCEALEARACRVKTTAEIAVIARLQVTKLSEAVQESVVVTKEASPRRFTTKGFLKRAKRFHRRGADIGLVTLGSKVPTCCSEGG